MLRPATPLGGNLQSAARGARYALLEAWRSEQGLDWVLTAHHADDQAETLLMRLNRGSGVGGLAGIRRVNGRVLRPLLGWRRAELGAIVAAAGLEPIIDPSNRDEKFDRRACAASSRRRVDRPARRGRSAQALAEAEEALDWAAERLFAERSRVEGDMRRLDPAELPAELLRRLLLRALRRSTRTPRRAARSFRRLLATLQQGGAATLAGVKAEAEEGIWRFAPAPPRGSG